MMGAEVGVEAIRGRGWPECGLSEEGGEHMTWEVGSGRINQWPAGDGVRGSQAVPRGLAWTPVGSDFTAGDGKKACGCQKKGQARAHAMGTRPERSCREVRGPGVRSQLCRGGRGVGLRLTGNETRGAGGPEREAASGGAARTPVRL